MFKKERERRKVCSTFVCIYNIGIGAVKGKPKRTYVLTSDNQSQWHHRSVCCVYVTTTTTTNGKPIRIVYVHHTAHIEPIAM